VKAESIVHQAVASAEARRDASPREKKDGQSGLLTAVVALLLFGWWFTSVEYKPGSSLGYNLGLTGGLMMLVLLLYPLRKRVAFMRNWLPVRHWFRAHMYLGVMGPVVILLHSRLSFGSINGTVAFTCMAAVFTSGLVGRFIYTKIHHGLYGRNKTLEEVKKVLGLSEENMRSRFHFAPEVQKRLEVFEADSLGAERGLAKTWRFMTQPFRARWAYWKASRELTHALSRLALIQDWDRGTLNRRVRRGKHYIRSFIHAVRDVTGFSAYERIFSYWHLLHVPLLFLLMITGVIHVIAVHMY